MKPNWNEQELEILKEHWGKISASEISKLLDGKSRNAVIGKARRMELQHKPVVKKIVTKRRYKKAQPSRAEQLIELDARSFNFTFAELENNQCRFANSSITERSNHRFCGHTITNNKKVYCDEHLAIAYVKMNA